jgi:hypothetical protein
MLTILAWMVFVPAVIWNVIIFGVAFFDLIDDRSVEWLRSDNIFTLVLSLAVLLIPGVYLFGWM